LENSRRLKIAVAGFGNILMGDEGVGVHIINELSKVKSQKSNVELIDGGTNALDIILSLKDMDKLVVIDAMKNGGKPGNIYKFPNFQISKFPNLEIVKSSLHELSIIDSLKIAEKLGTIPKEIVFIGVEPKEIEPKMELSEELKNKISEIIKTVLCEVKQ